MHGAGGEENRPGNERTTTMFEGLLASRSVLPSASVLSPYSLLAFFFWVSPLQSSCLFLSTGFLHFLLSLFCRFYMQKMKAKTERQSLLVYGFSFFLRFLPFFFSSVPSSVFSFSPSLVTEMDEDNGTAASAHSRWSLLLGTLKTMATPVLCSFSFLLLILLSVEMMRETAMKTCYAGWVHAPASVFFLLLTVAFCFLFFFFRSSPFFSFYALSFCVFPTSL